MTLNVEAQVCSKCVYSQGALAFPTDCCIVLTLNVILQGMISGFRHEVDEKRALVDYYAGSCSNLLLMFWDLSFTASAFKNPK
jgi:hypothetical protein